MVDEIPVVPAAITAFLLWGGWFIHLRREVIRTRKELRGSRTASK